MHTQVYKVLHTVVHKSYCYHKLCYHIIYNYHDERSNILQIDFLLFSLPLWDVKLSWYNPILPSVGVLFTGKSIHELISLDNCHLNSLHSWKVQAMNGSFFTIKSVAVVNECTLCLGIILIL